MTEKDYRKIWDELRKYVTGEDADWRARWQKDHDSHSLFVSSQMTNVRSQMDDLEFGWGQEEEDMRSGMEA